MDSLPHIDRWIHGDHDIMPDVEVPMKFVCEYTNPENGEVLVVDYWSEEVMEKINRNLEKSGTKARWRFKLDNKGNRIEEEENDNRH